MDKQGKNVFVIAEIGSNWHPVAPDESIADMVQAAADAGVDAVKMQDWAPIEAMPRSDEWKARCTPWTLTYAQLKAAQRVALDRGLEFFCSVFTPEAVWRAGMLLCQRVKIASSEITNQGIIASIQAASAVRQHTSLHCEGQADRPSPGTQAVFASLGEVQYDYQVTTLISRLNTVNLVLMGCVAEYPVERPLDLLDAFTYAQQFGLPAGVSSHVPLAGVIPVVRSAIKRGAVAVEAHLRLADVTPDDAPDNGPWALYPSELAELVQAIREVEL